ncbi:MAG: hypothetical protein A2V79_09285 [Betaproteobacteria bacterium RBG_16_56_24]|nr:MAG: hypothetical protein A2V79_09285 [Betaproteobacteria bacterium RBG_16_56_24]
MLSESHAAAILDVRVTNLERVVERVSVAVESIDESLKTLTKLDVQHTEIAKAVERAFEVSRDHETRIRAIESEMPTLKLVRRWALSGMATFAGALCLAIIALVLK